MAEGTGAWTWGGRRAAALRRLVLAALALGAGGLEAQPADSLGARAGRAAAGALVVALPDAPPFAERGPDGTWAGLGVEVAVDVAQRLGRPVRFVAADSAEADVAAGRADLALAPMTPAGEAAADYTAPFYSARLGVARPAGHRLLGVLGRLFSPTFLWIAGGLAGLLLIVGTAVWAVERASNEDQFREAARPGIWDGFWWAGVTMTTIGYGDKAPQTVPGKSLALLWMLVSMAVTASLTASLVSALGMGRGGGGVELPEDLQGDRVGVVAGTPAAAVLREARVEARAVPTVAAGLEAVEADSLDAVAGSAPRLRAARPTASTLRVEETGAELERWAFAAAPGSPLRDAASRAVLDVVQSADWPSTVRRHVGSSSP